jgi:nucleoside-diphosphate-sugar epimerase
MHYIPYGYTIFEADLESVVSYLEDDLQSIRDAHLFITGGTGFFGIWLLECLLWANQTRSLNISMTVLSRSPTKFIEKRAPHLRKRVELSFVCGDLMTFEFPSKRATHVLHLASEPNLVRAPSWAQSHLNSAVYGTGRLLEMAETHRPEAFLITTSGAVYSPIDSVLGDFCVEGPAGVGDYASERVVYGQSKRMMEVMVSVASQSIGFRALIARCFAFVGPYLSLDGNYAIGNFIRDSLMRRSIIVHGDGTPLRSYLYASDLIIWLIRILARGRSGVPYNVGGDEVVSIGALAQMVARIGETADRVLINGTPVPGMKPSAYLPSLARTQSELGLYASVPLEEAIRRTLVWNRRRLTDSEC